MKEGIGMILYWILGVLQIIVAIIVLVSEKGWVKNKKDMISGTTLLGT